MTVTPVCLVRDGGGPWVSTTTGVNVTPGNVISIKLVDATGVSAWYLRCLGTDETTVPPTLSGKIHDTDRMSTPTTVSSFTCPDQRGMAFVFESTVDGGGPSVTTTFGIYVTTTHGKRVGAVNEGREGNSSYGWITLLNPLVRVGAAEIRYDDSVLPNLGVSTVQAAIDAIKTGGLSGFTAGGDLSGTSTDQTVVGLQTYAVSAAAPSDGQALIWNAGTSTWTPSDVPSGFIAGTDLSGTSSSQTVVGLQGRAVAATAPLNGQVLTWNTCSYQWEPWTPSTGGGGAKFAWGRPDDYGIEDPLTPPTTGQALRVASNQTNPRYIGLDTRTGIGVDYAGPILWVARQGSNDVLWFDTYYWRARTIPVETKDNGTNWHPKYIAIDTANQAAWMGGPNYASIIKVDMASETTELAILPSYYPYGGIFYDAVQRRIVVVPTDQVLVLIDNSGTQTTRILSGATGNGVGILCSTDGWYYWFGMDGGGHLYVCQVDPLTGIVQWTASSTMPFERPVNAVEYGGYVFFTVEGGSLLYRVNKSTQAVSTIAIAGTNGLTFDGWGTSIWVACTAGFQKVISITGTMTLSTLVAPLDPLDSPLNIIFDSYNSVLWTTCEGPTSNGAYLGRIMPWSPGATVNLAQSVNGVLEWFNPVAIGGDLAGTGAAPTVVGLQTVPVASLAPSNAQVLTYNSCSGQWEPKTPTPSSGGGTLDVVLGASASTDALMYLDDSRDSTSPGVRAYPLPTSLTNTTVNLETGGGWPSPTQPYAYDAVALKPDLFLVAYRYGTALRLRAVTLNYATNSWVVGTAVDLTPDGGSNEVAYISCCRAQSLSRDFVSGVVAWANPTTSKGYMVAVTVSGTTITTSTVVTFSATAVVGTALAGDYAASTGTGLFTLAWADSSSNSGRSQMGTVTRGSPPTIALHGGAGPYTFTSMVASKIGQPTFRAGSRTDWCAIMFGTDERRVRYGFLNYNNPSGDIFWDSNDTRIDVYDAYGASPGYVLSSSQYGTGDFYSDAGGACLLSGNRAGFTDYIYLVHVQREGGPLGLSNYVPEISTKVVGGGSGTNAYGNSFLYPTLRFISTDFFVFSAYSSNNGGSGFMMFGFGRVSPTGGLTISMPQLISSGGYLPLGTQPQHNMQFFRITDNYYGSIRSVSLVGTNYLMLAAHEVADPRCATGFLRASGSRGSSQTLTVNGGAHTFTSLSWTPVSFELGRSVYVGKSYEPTPNHARTNFRVGYATDTAAIVVQLPSSVR